MDKSKLTTEQLVEFANDYLTFAKSCEKGYELVEESRLKLVTSGAEVLDELPEPLAEEVSNALIDDGIKKKIHEGRKHNTLSDKEEQT